jgi:teichuronic acid biosynthesis glycosyltransferase TuaH
MTGHDLVVVSLEPWDRVWRRNQYLVDGLLRADPDTRVLFVEPPKDITHDRLDGRRAEPGAGLRRAPGAERRWLLQTTKVIPRVLGGWADRAAHRAVRRAATGLGMTRPVLWVNDAHGAGLLARTRWPALYDVTDDWSAADRPARELRRLRRDEAVLTRGSAEVVVCSPALAARYGRDRDVTLIPNAVDVERYRRPAPRPADLPPAPTAVYVGTLHADRLDVAVVAAAARRLAVDGGSVVLVGPDALEAGERRALDAAGVVRLGARAFGEVPAYLQHATALIVPHVVDAFTDSLDPIKLYEYRAVGRPVVSTGVAGFRDLPGVVLADAERFPEAVAEVVAADPPTTVEDGIPDWSDRVAAFAGAVERVASARR